MTQFHASKTAAERQRAGTGRRDSAISLLTVLVLFTVCLGEAAALERVQQKREPVSCPDTRQNSDLAPDDDSKKRHLALEASRAEAAEPGAPERGSHPSASASSDVSPRAAPVRVVFQAEERAVSNWRAEARDNLDVAVETKAKLCGGAEVPDVPRCVKLNNYWCIKRARWAGEIAADAEGPVAFASALDGAIAAAMLLRRYYIDYSRRSALAIVSRWAPAQCAGAVAAAGRRRKPGAVSSGKQLAGIAPLGIQNTLRARWLATHRPGFPAPGKPVSPRRSIASLRPVPMMRAPEIAVGMGEAQGGSIKIAALDFAAPAPEASINSCGGETQRIQNYAWRAIEGLAPRPSDDLQLFPGGGAPGANLPRLLENMAKVEIGPLAARAGLIADAVARLPPKAPPEGLPQGRPAGGMSEAVQMRQ